MTPELPDYARREGNTVYVETIAQSFQIIDFLDPEEDVYIVIEDPKDSLTMQKTLKGFGL